LWALHPAFDETLDNTCRGERIIPQDDFTILYEGVRLDKKLPGLHRGDNQLPKGLQYRYDEITHHFLLQDHISNILVPAG